MPSTHELGARMLKAQGLASGVAGRGKSQGLESNKARLETWFY